MNDSSGGQIVDFFQAVLPWSVKIVVSLFVVAVVLGTILRLLSYWRKLNQKSVLLEIIPPAFQDKVPVATTQLNSVLHGLLKNRSFKDSLLRSASSFSLEIASTRDKGIRYLIRTSEDNAELIKQTIAAYVADAKVTEIDDYIPDTQDSSVQIFKQGGHTAVRKNLNKLLFLKAINLNRPELNEVITLNTAISYKGASGANVRNEYYKTQDCIKALRKKLGQYKEHNFKDRKTIKNYWMTKKGRQEKNEFLQKDTISLIDYFYWMRIKANYKDVDFLNFDIISSNEATEYISFFVSAADKYANALNIGITEMKQKRDIK